METERTRIIGEIKSSLGDNFKTGDDTILSNILEDMIIDALMISNRKDTEDNLKKLSPEIKRAVMTIYLQRGTEDVQSQSVGGQSNSYMDAITTLQKDIVKANKRVVMI